MVKAGYSRHAQKRREEGNARRNAVMLMVSVLLHVALILLLPGLALTNEQPVQLFVELIRPAELNAGARPPLPVADNFASLPLPVNNMSPAQNPATESLPRQNPALRPESLPLSGKPLDSPQPAPQEQRSADDPARSASPNDATAVTKPQQIVPKSETHVPASGKPSTKPPTKPAAKPADKSGDGDKSKSGGATEVKPHTNVDNSKPPQKPEESKPAVEKPGSDAPKKPQADDGGPSGNGSDKDGGGNVDAPNIGLPAAPPGPSQKELDLLGAYGDAALKRIKGQARNPEYKSEGSVVFEFDVARDGSLLDVRIISYDKSNLGKDVNEAAHVAFNDEHEIIPFPKGVTVKQWTFRKKITYPLY